MYCHPPQVLAETSGIPRSLLGAPKPVQEQAGVLPPSDGSDQAVDRAGLSQPKAYDIITRRSGPHPAPADLVSFQLQIIRLTLFLPDGNILDTLRIRTGLPRTEPQPVCRTHKPCSCSALRLVPQETHTHCCQEEQECEDSVILNQPKALPYTTPETPLTTSKQIASSFLLQN